MSTPPRLRIPASQAAAFAAIGELPDDDFVILVRALTDPGPTGQLDQLRERVAAALPDTPRIDAIISMLFAVDRLRESRRETSEVTASRVAAAAGVDASADLRERIRVRLAEALGSPGLRRASKATDLLYSNERTIDSLRIVTELRPLFEDDPTITPEQAVVVHRLEVNFIGQTGAPERRDFSLDNSDLDSLYEVVERARQKARTVGELARQAGLSIIRPMDDPLAG